MRVILSGGGTGGHIYPALAIAKELEDRFSDVEILYVGKSDSLEEELAKRNSYKFAPIRVKGLPRKKINKDSLLSILELVKGLGDAGEIINEFKPDVVIGTGGYVCAPILIKAQTKKIPTMIQEQNAYAGKTNRLIGKRANAIALSFEEARKYFPENANVIFTGNPIRKEFRNLDISKAKESLNIEMDRPIVLSLGGSGGQESTNDAVLEMMKEHSETSFKLIHITGKDHYKDFLRKMPKDVSSSNYEIMDYSHQIPNLLQVSTLTVASSSAMTLAEISATGKPSILIPKAYTAGNHQWHNAKSYEKEGASIVIEEEQLTGQKLYETIHFILDKQDKMKEMSLSSKKMGRPDAVIKIVDEIVRLVKDEG